MKIKRGTILRIHTLQGEVLEKPVSSWISYAHLNRAPCVSVSIWKNFPSEFDVITGDHHYWGQGQEGYARDMYLAEDQLPLEWED